MTHAHEIPDVTLPDGTRMPIVGFGTWRLRGDEAYTAVRSALDLGYRHLDTATMYGNEAEVGRAVRDSGVPREELYLTTKLPAERAGRARRTIEESVHALGTDHVDLWLIHWPPNGRAAVGVWEDLLAARADGLTTSVGVSNYDLDQIDELVKATGELPAVNQIPWYPSRHDPALLAGHRERGVVVEGYSPLKGSDLRDPVLTAVATAHGVTVPQVILRWHLEHEIVIIPKSASPDRMATNLDLFGFALTPAEVASIDGLAA
jgi:diketogulonate reductase-like aldo/keto reductase